LNRLEGRLERIEGAVRLTGPPRERTSAADERGERLPTSAWYAPSQSSTSLPPRDIATVHGRLNEMSLPTVLAMFEFERRSGRLTIESPSGERLCVSMHDGALLSCRINERAIHAVKALRQAIGWREGAFWFEPVQIDPIDASPQSIGSLLIEATRQNDEAARTG
jgi:hypothetical protein